MWAGEDPGNLPPVKTLPELELETRFRNRRWHDVPCTVLFVLMMGACITIIMLAFTRGDPSLLPATELEAIEAELTGFAQTEVVYLKQDANYILASIGLAVLLATVWFYLLRQVTLAIIYQTIGMAVVLLVGLGVYLYQAARRYGTWEVYFFMIFSWVVAFGIIMVAIWFREKIGVATELMQSSGKVIVRRPDIMLVVAAAMFVYGILSTIWILAFVYLACVPEATALFTSVTTTTTLAVVEFDRNYELLFWVLLVGGAWLLSAVFAVETYIIARVALHEHELVKDRDAVPFNSMKQGIQEAFGKSLGSILFASLLVGVAWLAVIISIFGYMTRCCRRREAPQMYCVSVLSKFLAYIVELATDATIVYMAYTGQSFLTSAKELSAKAINEVSLVLVSETIMTYVLLVGQFGGTALVSAFGIVLIDTQHGHIGALSTLVIVLVSFLIFHTVARAIFVSFNAGLVFHLLRKETNQPDAIERLVQSTFTSNKE